MRRSSLLRDSNAAIAPPTLTSLPRSSYKPRQPSFSRNFSRLPTMRLSRATAVDLAWLLVCVIASSAWCLACAVRIGPTFDEPTYIAEGLTGWRTSSHGGLMSLGTMPLAIDLSNVSINAGGAGTLRLILEQTDFGASTPDGAVQPLPRATVLLLRTRREERP